MWLMRSNAHYLVKLKMLNAHVLPGTIELLRKKNSGIYLTSTVFSKFARFESS